MRYTVFAIAALAAALPVWGQTTAHQGGEKTEFASPMVLEMPFFMAAVPTNLTETLVWARGTDSTNRYHCDNVEISDFAMKLKSVKNGKAEMPIMVTFHNRPGHDRRVSLTVEAVNGDEVVAKANINGVKVEETDSVQRFSSMTVARDKLIKGTTNLRLTLEVVSE